MRYLLTMILVMSVAHYATGSTLDSWSNRGSPSRQGGSPPAYDSREGGEDISTAIEIPSEVDLLPYHDSGATCDNVDDYDEACPYTGSMSPDVVYSFTPSEDVVVSIDLCASQYDTKVFVYDAAENLIACDDDACGESGYRSLIYSLSLSGGVTYFIIVDGYGGDCGAYDLTVDRWDCAVQCPPGAQLEGEPPCADGYVDEFNSGCNPPGLYWTTIEAGPEGCATVCGKSCTYVYDGLEYRDTDWYEATAAGGTVTFSCAAEFLLLIAIGQFTDCSVFPSTWTSATPCVTAELSVQVQPGSRVWFWVGPQHFGGVPESTYVFTVCALQPAAIPVEGTSWGRVKSRYR